MRSVRHIAAVAAGALLLALGLAPTAQAARVVELTVTAWGSYEAVTTCPYAAGSGPCGLVNGSARFMIQVKWGSWRPKNTPIDVGYQLVDGTATAGADYLGPTSGTVTIPTNAAQAYVNVALVMDGVAEPSETFSLELTSASVPADLSDSDTATITDGAQLPADCAATLESYDVMSLTCGNRPATHAWRLSVVCASIGGGEIGYGNTVTGNGTSRVHCGGYAYHPAFQTV